MTPRGQILIIVAVLLMAGLFLLALVTDGGRIAWRRTQGQRAAQAAADAGIGIVAEEIVTLAVARQTDAASNQCPSCTPTPDSELASRWLTDEDRSTLVAPPMRTQVAVEAEDYLRRNGFDLNQPEVESMEFEYPVSYHPSDEAIRLRVQMAQTVAALIAGILGRESFDIPVEALSQVQQR
jgi:hypothetical protein